MKMKLLSCLVLGLFFLFNARAQSSRDTLNQYISELQKSPDDYALMEKIISVSLRVKPAPAIPEDARKKYVMGSVLFDEAKTKEDYELAIVKLKEALLIAPWYSDAYKKLGLSQELAGLYDEAIKNLKLFMLSPLSEEDKRKAQDEVYVIEAKKEKAEKEKTENAKKEEAERKLHTIEGVWCSFEECEYDDRVSSWIISRDGNGNYSVSFKQTFQTEELMEFHGSDHEYTYKWSVGGGTNIHIGNATLSESGLTLKGYFTIYYANGTVAQETTEFTRYRKR